MEDKNFEKYFRQQFGKNIPEESWNTPSDAVWDNINQQMGHQRNRFGLVFFMIFASLFLLGSVGFLMWKNHQKNLLIEQLEDKLSDCEVLSSQNFPDKDEEENLSAGNIGSSATSEAFKEPLFTPSDVSTSKGKSFRSKNLYHSREKLQTYDMVLNDLAQDTKENMSEMVRSFEGSGPIENTGRDMISETQMLPVLKLTPVTNRTSVVDIEPVSVTKTKDVQDSDEKKFDMGVSYGLLSWQNRQNGQLENELNEILIHERLSVSSAIGAAFQYKLNEKWYLSSGVNYFSREMTTMYHVDLPYDSQNEIVNGNEYENTFEHSLPTGWGNVNTTLILSRVLNSSLTGNDFVPVDMSIRHKLHSAEIPLMVQYFPWGRENGLFMNAGLNTEWIWSEGTTQMISKSHHNTIKEKDTHSSFDTKQIHNWLFSATLGTGWHRNLNKHIGLRVLAEYGVGLNPVARVENYSLNLDRAGISVAMFYQFPSR
jgi:hypothetical protein